MKSNPKIGMSPGRAVRAVATRCPPPRACLLALLLACTRDQADSQQLADEDAGEHDHASHDHGAEIDATIIADGGSSHHVRDLETQPCNAQTWRELGVDLRECQLPAEDLEDESLRHVDLSDSDLSAANLKNADLFNARLVRAKLGSAALDGANLAGVDCTNADLRGATLLGADLSTAVVTDALLEGAVTNADTTCPDGSAGPCW